MKRITSAWLSLVVAALCGCSKVPFNLTPWREEKAAPSTANAVKAGPKKVQASGDGFALGEVEQAALTPPQFADRVHDLLRRQESQWGRPADGAVPAPVARFIQRYPDIALAVLREPATAAATPEVLVAVAQAYDRQCTRAAAAANWATLAVQGRPRGRLLRPMLQDLRQGSRVHADRVPRRQRRRLYAPGSSTRRRNSPRRRARSEWPTSTPRRRASSRRARNRPPTQTGDLCNTDCLEEGIHGERGCYSRRRSRR